MAGGTLFDVANSFALWTWKLFAAISIVTALAMIRELIYAAYETAIETSGNGCSNPVKWNREKWQVRLNLQMAWLFVMIIGVVAAAGMVIDDEWVKQITSACIVGVGFALRQFIEDIVWGLARRSDESLMVTTQIITVMTGKGQEVTGTISEMNITSCHIKTSGDKMVVVPWGGFRMYSYQVQARLVKD